MREIKFKAWDKKDKVVRDVVGMSFYHESVSVDIEYGKYLQDDIKRFELMQYTGLKDKNGVEIYEGGILKGRSFQYQEDIKGEVYYTNRGTWDCDSFIIGGLNEDCEVIGNIYEHQHLLEEV